MAKRSLDLRRRLKESTRSFGEYKYMWIAVIVDFAMNIASLILFLLFSQEFHVEGPFAEIFAGLDGLIIVLSFLSVTFKQKLGGSGRKQSRTLGYCVDCLKVGLWIIYLLFIIAKISYAIGSGMGNPLGLTKTQKHEFSLSHDKRLTLIIVLALSIVTDFGVIGVLTYMWVFTSSRYFLMFLCCLAQFVLGIIEINLINLYAKNAISSTNTHVFGLFIHSGVFIVGGGLLGICLCVCINEKNRLTSVIRDFIFFIDCYFCLLTVLSIVSFSFCLRQVTTGISNDDNNLIINAALLGCSVIIGITIIICTRRFRMRLPPKLEVEVLDLDTLSPKMKNAYAALIDKNRKFNSGVSGRAALDLMEAYSKSPLQDMSCKVLRVYRPCESNTSSNENSKPSSNIWDSLDEERSIFNEQLDWADEEATLDGKEGAIKPLSKNKLKRLAKKAQKKKNDAYVSNLTDADYFEDVNFNKKLESTEALVLLTSIEDFDLTCTFKGRIGRFISRNFGKESKSKLLTVRFGLLGYHWPFKRSTFYCSKPKKPVARSAAVMYAIKKWNSNRPKSERCTLLLDPIYKSNLTSDAINFGGWIKIHMPPSHIIDLRPHKSQTLQQYLKSIKYRAQNAAFDAANGEVIEVNDFNQESCEKVIDMWSNIAEARSDNGQTSTLASPDALFIESIGKTSNESKDRSLLFLKVDEQVIASCVLFRLGETITSDIQGLDHEVSRKYKAYFVMMQEVIRIALKEGKSFVDFGPTTEKPKMDIGCKSVPLVGAMNSTYTLLNPIIAFSAKKVDV